MPSVLSRKGGLSPCCPTTLPDVVETPCEGPISGGFCAFCLVHFFTMALTALSHATGAESCTSKKSMKACFKEHTGKAT